MIVLHGGASAKKSSTKIIIQNYEEKRAKLNAEIDNLLFQITELHQKTQKGEL